VVNKKTWFSHWFRGGMGGFPYPMKGKSIYRARRHSINTWTNNKWPLQTRSFGSLIKQFWPVPTWTQASLDELLHRPNNKAIIYYTDNKLKEPIASQVRDRLRESAQSIPIVAVSQKPLDYGDKRVCVGELGQSRKSILKQLIAGLEATLADTVYLAEHDCLYAPRHFCTVLHDRSKFIYNKNVLWGHYERGQQKKCWFDRPDPPRFLMSQLVADREPLLQALRERLDCLERGLEFPSNQLGTS